MYQENIFNQIHLLYKTFRTLFTSVGIRLKLYGSEKKTHREKDIIDKNWFNYESLLIGI